MTDEEDIMSNLVIIISIIITVFTVLLIIIYSLNKSFKSIPFYFNIFFCVMISLDDILRFVHSGANDSQNIGKVTTWCKIQAITLSILDKYILLLITIYSLINYLSQFNVEFYQNHMKGIFIFLTITGILLSIIISIIFYIQGINYKSLICYVDTYNDFKKIVDSIYTILLFLVNSFCLICVIIHMIKLIKEYRDNGYSEKEKSCKNHLIRLIIDLIINLIIFGYILLLINKWIPSGAYKDFVYILLCLVAELFYTINKQLLKAFINIITCKKEENNRNDSIIINDDYDDCDDNEIED